jgi:toxin CptA
VRSASTISFEYRPSRRLLAALLGVTALAAFAVGVSGLPLPLRLVLLPVLLAGAAVAVVRHLHSGWARVGWLGEGGWRLLDSEGNEQVAELVSARVLGTWIVLRLRRARASTAALVLAPDNAGPDLRRHLRMRLSASTDSD